MIKLYADENCAIVAPYEVAHLFYKKLNKTDQNAIIEEMVEERESFDISKCKNEINGSVEMGGEWTDLKPMSIDFQCTLEERTPSKYLQVRLISLEVYEE